MPATGTAGYSGDGGPAIEAELNNPRGLALDPAGDLFIADTGNNRIREVVAATGEIITVAGDGTAGYSGDGGAATARRAQRPDRRCLRLGGRPVHRRLLEQRDSRGGQTTGDIITVAGNGTAGYSGDGGPATAAELDLPVGVAVDSAGTCSSPII